MIAPLVASDATSIGEVIERLQTIDGALPLTDGVAWFTKLYLSVTEAVQETLSPVAFQHPAFVARLDIVFANLYFQALRGPAGLSKAWAPLIEARSDTRIAPIQFALAGMNAHINRDLPVALVSTCAELEIDLAAARREHADFLRVNTVLAATEERVKRWFATDFLAVLDHAFGNVDDRIAMWKVERAREAAWVQGQTLWALRAVPSLLTAHLETLDHIVGFAGRGLLVPLD